MVSLILRLIRISNARYAGIILLLLRIHFLTLVNVQVQLGTFIMSA